MSRALRVTTTVEVLDEHGRTLYLAIGQYREAPWPVVDDEAPAADPFPRGPAVDVAYAVDQAAARARTEVGRTERLLAAAAAAELRPIPQRMDDFYGRAGRFMRGEDRPRPAEEDPEGSR